MTGTRVTPAEAEDLQLPAQAGTPDFGEDGLDRGLQDRSQDHRRAIAVGLVLVDSTAFLLSGVLWGGGPTAVAGEVVVALTVLFLAGAYRPRITLSALEEAPRLTGPLLLALLIVDPVLTSGAVDRIFVLHALTNVPMFVAGRALAYAVIRWARRTCRVQAPTLILGGGTLGMELLTTLYEHPELGLRPVGFLDAGAQLDDRRPLGRSTDMDAMFARHDVRTVIVAYGTAREADLVGVLRSAAMRHVEIYIVPRFFDIGLAPTGPDVDSVWGVPLYRVRRAALRRGAWRVKRMVDVAVAGTGLVLLSPLLLLLAAAVRLSSPGPVLFRQERTGHGGRQITVLKLRSLRVPAATDAEGPGRGDGAPEPQAAMQARRDDVQQRQTPIGSFLRRTSLDELPQLWNILRGDMSLVGPRPEEHGYAVEFGESVYGYRERHRLPVGLTGWAQVHDLRGNTSIADRARFDNQYIEHWSPWRDVVIVARTVGAVLRQTVGRGLPRDRDADPAAGTTGDGTSP
jgi:exopolysaccharide biosynthesis polyprenyl glycosylphosphotransferase